MKYVALFRGINVGKAKRIAMADLRKLLGSLGYANVATLLNSGNAVFDAPAESPAALAKRIREAVAKKLGVDAFVIVKSAKDIAAVIEGNKLGSIATNPSRLLVAMTGEAGGLSRLKPIPNSRNEVVHIGKHAAYLWCADGILQSKAWTAFLGDLEGSGTTRNWATIEKINAMLQA